VLGGVCFCTARIDAPGVVVHGGGGTLLFGEVGGGPSPRCERLRSALGGAGAEAKVPPAISATIWEKFVSVCGLSGAMALMRLPLGPILACPEAGQFLRATMEEAEAVARALRVPIAAGHAAGVFASLSQWPPGARSSMLTDVLGGRRLEVDWLNGAIVRLGREHGVPTPANAAILAALKPHAGGAPEIPPP
jgi:2-dehydropantoate 2-reductase